MDRQIKFRAWDKISKKMWIPDIVNFATGKPGIIAEKGKAWVYDCPIMQYTGLKDCDGKEIYEGDILGEIYLDGWTHKSAPVIFDAGAFSLELEAGKYCPCLYEIPQEHRKVIGNIYEKEK